MLQQTVGMAFFLGGGGIAKDAGQKPDGGVYHRLRGDLAAGQDEVAKADLLDRVMVQHALVDTLEPSAKHRDALGRGPAAGHGLVEGLSPRGKVGDRPGGAVGGRADGGLVEGGGHDIGA